jgi:hypothetical protein
VFHTVITEKMSYRARPQQFGRSVGLRAPGMFIERPAPARPPPRTGDPRERVSTRTPRLSRFWPGGGKAHAQAVVAALAPLGLWRLGPTRSLLSVSFRLSGMSRSPSLVCDVPEVLDASWESGILCPRIRARDPTRACAAARASQRHTSPETERVGPKVQVSPYKSPPAMTGDRKRGSQARNAPALRERRGLRGAR